MGGLGVAMQEYNYLNFVNPASVANLRVTTYTVAGQTSFLTLKDNKASQSGHTTELSYIALGFPLGKKAGFTLGLQPLTSIGYSFTNEQTDNNQIRKLTRYKGKGGANRLYGNFGINVYEGLSIGLEGAFIFGNVQKTIIESKKGVVSSTKYESDATLRGLEVKTGIQYKTNLSKGYQLHTGLAVKFGGNLKNSGEEKMYSLIYNNSGYEIPKNTLYDRSFKRDIKIPVSIVAGVGFGKVNKWYLGLNSEYQRPQESIKVDNMRYEEVLRTSFGGYYIPKINSISSYWDRVTYRGGLRFERTGLMLKGANSQQNFSSINDFGINVGLGLPLPNQLSNVNLGFEYGQRGTTTNNLVKENYFNVKLSLSLNSLNWFIKRKID
ncbi:MAG: hypothetical protein CR961_00765 [Polaribacter sp.]|nr:MAG: hypothetical protein CR961_00765 [Polaribacter sp.]